MLSKDIDLTNELISFFLNSFNNKTLRVKNLSSFVLKSLISFKVFTPEISKTWSQVLNM